MIHKFLDRPVPFMIITNANERKEELISEFEDRHFKLSEVHRNALKLLPCRWLGMELVKLIKGVNNEQNRNTND